MSQKDEKIGRGREGRKEDKEEVEEEEEGRSSGGGRRRREKKVEEGNFEAASFWFLTIWGALATYKRWESLEELWVLVSPVVFYWF